jgi:hypothetical protein
VLDGYPKLVAIDEEADHQVDRADERLGGPKDDGKADLLTFLVALLVRANPVLRHAVFIGMGE